MLATNNGSTWTETSSQHDTEVFNNYLFNIKNYCRNLIKDNSWSEYDCTLG